jgi:hypothetical protein
VSGAGAGAQVAVAGDDGVRERRRACERLEVRRAAALRRAAHPGSLLGRVAEAVLDVPAYYAPPLRLRQRPDADVRLVGGRVQEADAARPDVQDVDLTPEQRGLELGVDKVGAGGGVVEALSASLRNSDTRCVVFTHVAWKNLRAQALVACQRRSARAALAKGEASEGQAP